MSNNKESSHAAETPVSAHDAQGPGVTPGLGSPGVQRIEALSSHLHILDRTIVEASSSTVEQFAAGAVLYQVSRVPLD
ncbi:siderochrome-iron transporter [Aspergillus luchuensis]|uniref:Siderochrome-iron transporter n=1 Tax=Aspergillus kawachii TaxID=1069201 RepID=A0A146G0S1_ASPKA|nr:siderochrome-iron transporter [Aspergillus luchuensis]